MRNDANQPLYFVTSIVDITKRKKAEQQLEEEKAKDEAILSSIGDAVMACDKDGMIILFNGVAEKLTGFLAKEAVGNHYNQVFKFIREKDEKPGDDFIAKAIVTGKSSKMANHTLLVKKDHTKIPVADSASPLLNSNGNTVGCVVVFRDVTQEREIDKAKTEFVSLASHQLRTPLTSAKWYAEMLLKKATGKLTLKQREYIEELYQANERMIILVRNLLNVSRIEMGDFAVNPELVDVGKLLKIAVEEQKIFVREKKQKVVVKIEKSLPKVLTDSQLIRIIFQNLLGNAVEYTPLKGEITCTISKINNEVVIKVKDTGTGIPEKQQSRIFQKLFRGDNIRRDHSRGTGLGLYITKATVDALMGKIWFESKEGEGTTFWVSLPITGLLPRLGQQVVYKHHE